MFIRTAISAMSAAALGASVFVAVPAQAAQYPPTRPLRCGAAIDGRIINIKIRPLNANGYRFVLQKRKKKGKWVTAAEGRTRASDGRAQVKVNRGVYRLRCIGNGQFLNSTTSSGRVR